MNEYRDGLLLFDLMEKEIWQRSKTDTVGLTAFYENSKQKYVWKTRYDAEIFSSTQPDLMKKVMGMLKKGATAQAIKDKFNTADKLNVMMYDGIYEEGVDALPKNVSPDVKVTDVSQKGSIIM